MVSGSGKNAKVSTSSDASVEENNFEEDLEAILTQVPSTEAIGTFLYQKNRLDLAKALVDCPNFDLNGRDYSEETLLHKIVRDGNLTWFTWLTSSSFLQDIDWLARNKIGNNVFHCGSLVQNEEFLNLLFSSPAPLQLIFAANMVSDIPLFMATMCDNDIFLKKCCQRFRNEIFLFEDKDGNNILHVIARHDAVECFKMLKEHLSAEQFKILMSATNKDMLRPIQMAKKHDSLAVMEHMCGFRDGTNVQSLQWKAALKLTQYFVEEELKKESPAVIDLPDDVLIPMLEARMKTVHPDCSTILRYNPIAEHVLPICVEKMRELSLEGCDQVEDYTEKKEGITLNFN